MPGQAASCPWDGGICMRWIWSISSKFECSCEILVVRVCGLRQNFYLYSLYRSPDQDDQIYDCFLISMAAVHAEDVRESFLFVGDLKGHHQ